MVYALTNDNSKTVLTVHLPTFSVPFDNQVDHSIYFNFDIYSHEYEAEQITEDLEEDGTKNNRIENHQKINFSVRKRVS